MDFFDEINEAVKQDAIRRGVRCKPEVWQQFCAAAAKKTVSDDSACRPVEPVREVLNKQSIAEPAVEMYNVSLEEPVQNTCCCPSEIPADWDALRTMALNCRNCHLAASRQNVVFGEGNEHARLMFIGEGPGADEDATGRPFVGAAGQLLDKMIAAMHLAREEVYIANVVKCRPPGNRVPGEEEAAACMGYLERQIELINPEVIVLLGGTALHFLLKMDGISRLRGRWQEYKNIAVMPTFHPAFLLRKPESKREAWHDLKLVMAKLGIPV